MAYKILMSQGKWQNYFKPEVQKAGEELVAENAVQLTVTSDTAINGFVRGGGNSRVSFVSKSIAASDFIARCTCSRGTKGIACKHMWAVLLKTEEKHPDFLDSKTQVEVAASDAKEESPFKQKQAEFKKQQSERLKLRNKEIRLAKKGEKSKALGKPSKFAVSYPDDVQESLRFFSENGFEFSKPYSEDELKEARKTLSRVFHPDKGGTHEESLQLNQHFDTLMEYLES